jgi:hypothetical protein
METSATPGGESLHDPTADSLILTVLTVYR